MGPPLEALVESTESLVSHREAAVGAVEQSYVEIVETEAVQGHGSQELEVDENGSVETFGVGIIERWNVEMLDIEPRLSMNVAYSYYSDNGGED